MLRSALAATLVVTCMVPSAIGAQTPLPSHAPTPRQAPARSPGTPAKPQAVAVVNGVALLADRLQAAMNELMPYGTFHVGISPERVAKYRQDALDKIIDEELRFQDAKRLGLVARTADVDREYARVRRRYDTDAAFVAALRKAGITKATVRAEAARRALIHAAEAKVVTARCAASDAEARDYYAKNMSKFVMPEARRVYTLTIGVDPSAPRDQWDAAKKKADDLMIRLRVGDDFETLARQHSTDANKEQGGDLGYVHRGRLSEEFEAALGDAKAGNLFGPVQTIYGFHLLRVADVKPPTQRTFAEVHDRLIEELGDKKCADARSQWIRRLRERATIVIPEPPTPKPGTGAPERPVK